MTKYWDFYNKVKLEQLFEGKLDLLKKNHPEIRDKIETLSKGDPSGKNKYVQWMVRQALGGFGIDQIVNAIKEFHQKYNKLDKKDIHQYRTLTDLTNALKVAGMSKREKDQKLKEETITVFDDGKNEISVPLTRESSQKLGASTGLCISWVKARDVNRFYQYVINQQQVFIFVRAKKDVGMHPNIAVLVFSYGGKLQDIVDQENESINKRQAIKSVGANLFQKALEYGTQNSQQIKDKIIEIFQNRPEEEQEEIMSENPFLVQFIENPSEEMLLDMIDGNPEAIKWIQNPTERVQLAAIEMNPNAINFIANPSPKVKEYLAESAYLYWGQNK